METPTAAGVADPGAKDASSSNDELTTIAGGVDMEVTHLLGSKETVKVRQIPMSKLQQYMLAIGTSDTASEIALYCDKPKEWVNALDPLSAIDVAAKGQELNVPFANAWLRHQAKWRDVLVSSTASDGAAEQRKIAGSASVSSAQPSPTTTSSPQPK